MVNQQILYYDGNSIRQFALEQVVPLSRVIISFLNRDNSFRKIVSNVTPVSMGKRIAKYYRSGDTVVICPQEIYDRNKEQVLLEISPSANRSRI